MLGSKEVAEILDKDAEAEDDPFVVSPRPDLEKLKLDGAGSLDLRLGTWFVAMKARNTSLLSLPV